MAKATHSGTCQACGSIQKLPNGYLSNHGYSVQWGFFAGICQGARRLPFEQSCDYIKTCIARAEESILRNEKAIQDTQSNTSTNSEYHKYVKEKGGGYRVWVDAEVKNGEIHFENEKIPSIRLGMYGDDYAIARSLDAKRITWLEKQISNLKEYIDWQKSRIKDWKEQPLIPVK